MFMLQYHFGGSFLASTFPRRRLHCVEVEVEVKVWNISVLIGEYI